MIDQTLRPKSFAVARSKTFVYQSSQNCVWLAYTRRLLIQQPLKIRGCCVLPDNRPQQVDREIELLDRSGILVICERHIPYAMITLTYDAWVWAISLTPIAMTLVV
ncbi:hypothetical protein [Fimbriiglobus ruber]|uniref:Uncharacterized protein n=1 Tax=Fimbriiglobus ruber TaxID=1908690 RepID=A0A225DL72_9BACT|nr:hypothetical protein [Fimbriiglobus ruber]OWK36887.1 hypothetical protein FRUB_07939 [Fimbriiglobus ruber]